MQNNLIIRPALGAVLVLLIPLLIMLFRAPGWDWGPVDFSIMGALLFGAGFTYEFLSRKVHTVGAKVAVGVVVLLALLAVWSELAVAAVPQLIQALFG